MTPPNNHFIMVHRKNDAEPIHINSEAIFAVTTLTSCNIVQTKKTRTTIIDMGAGNSEYAYHVNETVEQVLKLIKGE